MVTRQNTTTKTNTLLTMRKLLFLMAIALGVMAFTSCDKEDITPDEVLTTSTIVITNTSSDTLNLTIGGGCSNFMPSQIGGGGHVLYHEFIPGQSRTYSTECSSTNTSIVARIQDNDHSGPKYVDVYLTNSDTVYKNIDNTGWSYTW
jgi:hypothetical protein